MLLKKVLEHLFAFDFDVRRFDIYKEQLMRSLKNYEAEQPYQHAVYYLALILTEHAWTKQELADAVSRTYFCACWLMQNNIEQSNPFQKKQLSHPTGCASSAATFSPACTSSASCTATPTERAPSS